VAKRRLFNPLRSLRKLFGHRGKKPLDSYPLSPNSSESDPLSITLTPDVTTSSSTDVKVSDTVTSPAQDFNETSRLEIHLFCTVELDANRAVLISVSL